MQSSTNEFPRNFDYVFKCVPYASKKYLFEHVMLNLLGLKRNVDFVLSEPSCIGKQICFQNLWLSEDSFQAILAFGRPKANGEIPLPFLVVSAEFLKKHPTKKPKSANTFQ
jgi:hypothetical protein